MIQAIKSRHLFWVVAVVIFYFRSLVFAQPTLDVTLQNSVCLEENIGIVNNSTGFDEYEWDFCVGDFNVEPTVTSTTMADLNFGSGFELVEDEGRWYAFVVDNIWDLNSVSRKPTRMGRLGGDK